MKRKLCICFFILIILLQNFSGIAFAISNSNSNEKNLAEIENYEEREYSEQKIKLSDLSEISDDLYYNSSNKSLSIMGVPEVDDLTKTKGVIYYNQNNAKSHTKDEIIEKYNKLSQKYDYSNSIYEVEPSDSAPYKAGVLKEQVQVDTINQINFFRWLYGLNNTMTIRTDRMERNAKGAVIQSANNELTHTPTQPADMDDDFYQEAYLGCYATTEYSGNCSYGSNISSSIEGYVDDSNNVSPNVGHRNSVLS